MRKPALSFLFPTVLAVLVLGAPPAIHGQVVLYDNGPLLTHPGAGCAGDDLSAAQDTTLGLTTRGFNQSLSGGYRVSDDFEVTSPGWELTEIRLYAYMAGSPSISPITAVNYQVWDGSPDDPLSTVVCGDPTTNRMLSTTFTNMYRALLSAGTDCARPIMEQVVDAIDCVLPPGTYWVDWQTDGNPAYTGPWMPPISIVGVTTTGDGLQQVTGAWQPTLDASLGTPLGLPFVIEGFASGLIFRDGFASGDTSRWTSTVP